MNLFKTMLCTCALSASILSCSNESKDKSQQEFKYVVDEFGDLQILRYQIPGWDALTLNQKAYIYLVSDAAKSGIDILIDQNVKYNIPIRKVLEKIISSYKGDKNTQEYKDFLEYTKRVFFSNGIHHHYAEDKIIPKCSEPYFKSLMVATGQEDKCAKLLPIIYDPTLYAQRQYTGKDGDLIAESSVNFYEDGITKDEVNSFYDKMAKPNDSKPLAYGLNSKLVKVNGELVEEV